MTTVKVYFRTGITRPPQGYLRVDTVEELGKADPAYYHGIFTSSYDVLLFLMNKYRVTNTKLETLHEFQDDQPTPLCTCTQAMVGRLGDLEVYAFKGRPSVAVLKSGEFSMLDLNLYGTSGFTQVKPPPSVARFGLLPLCAVLSDYVEIVDWSFRYAKDVNVIIDLDQKETVDSVINSVVGAQTVKTILVTKNPDLAHSIADHFDGDFVRVKVSSEDLHPLWALSGSDEDFKTVRFRWDHLRAKLITTRLNYSQLKMLL